VLLRLQSQRVPSGGLKRIGSTKILRAAVTAAWERAGTGATSKEIDLIKILPGVRLPPILPLPKEVPVTFLHQLMILPPAG